MKSTKTIEWLLVGGGDIATKRVAPALSSTGRSSLVGVCDVRRERAEEMARTLKAPEVHVDFDEALATTRANAVYVATPVALHAEFAVKALQAGKHVLVEKPLGLSGEEARRAARAAEAVKLCAGCAYFRRFYPRYLHARDMIAKGEFGRIVLVRMTYFSWFNPSREDPKYWRVIRSTGGGGPLADMATHMFDVLIGLTGMPGRVYARVRTRVQPYEVEDSSAILMETADGADVVASFHWNSRTWTHEFEIVGTEAKLKWHPYDTGKVVKTVGRDTTELDLPSAENVHAPLVDDFVRAALEGRAPAVPLAEALKTNVLLDAVYASAAQGKEVAP